MESKRDRMKGDRHTREKRWGLRLGAGITVGKAQDGEEGMGPRVKEGREVVVS